MNRVDRVNQSLNEAFSKNIGSLKDIKEGTQVVFKEGLPEAGMVGFVVHMNPSANTVDLKLGNATRVAVPIADLMMLSDEGGVGPVSKQG